MLGEEPGRVSASKAMVVERPERASWLVGS
jgi:hypothetical protein